MVRQADRGTGGQSAIVFGAVAARDRSAWQRVRSPIGSTRATGSRETPSMRSSRWRLSCSQQESWTWSRSTGSYYAKAGAGDRDPDQESRRSACAGAERNARTMTSGSAGPVAINPARECPNRESLWRTSRGLPRIFPRIARRAADPVRSPHADQRSCMSCAGSPGNVAAGSGYRCRASSPRAQTTPSQPVNSEWNARLGLGSAPPAACRACVPLTPEHAAGRPM